MTAVAAARSRAASMVAVLSAGLAACSEPGDEPGVDAGAGVDGAGAAMSTRYPSDAIRSPLTESVGGRLRVIAAAGATRDDVFAKIGDSHTVSPNLLTCYTGTAGSSYVIDLDGRDHLVPAIARFRGGAIGATTPFDRQSLAAEIGRTARWAITGTPSPLARELAATSAGFAVVAYGSNDMEQGTSHASALPGFWDAMNQLLDEVATAGSVAIVVGLPPRTDVATAARWIATYDAVTRALAEARQLPYVSMWNATAALPAQGLAGDGLHHNTYVTGGRAQPCVLTAAGLGFGNNQRNLHYLEALAGAAAIVDGGAAPDAEALPPVVGRGTAADPFVIDTLPFTHTFDTGGGGRGLDAYPGCDSGQDESGPEIVYHLALPAAAGLRVVVLDRGGVDVDVHVLDGGGGCVERADRLVDRTVPAGEHAIVVDSFVSGGFEHSGAYTLVVLACEPGDPDCEAGP